MSSIVIVWDHWLIASSLPTSDVTARTKKTVEVVVISNVTKIKAINEKFQGLSSALAGYCRSGSNSHQNENLLKTYKIHGNTIKSLGQLFK